MQTRFTLAQLARPDIAEADAILRKCVHCGFCTATCPTYVLLGDELDSPRGRIYLIKDMLEGGRGAGPRVARHLDRCLTCLACMTTCPSGVDYMHLVDIGRAHLERTFARPRPERALRAFLAAVLPRPGLFRLALVGARLAKPLARLMPGRLKALLAMAPPTVPPPSPTDRPQVFPAEGRRRMRVALMTGCAQRVLRPSINDATVRLLTRHGCEVVVAEGAGCCGMLAHHLGRDDEARAQARANVAAWDGLGLDAVVVNASGCGTLVKDYGHFLGRDPAWSERAAAVGGLARDVSEVVSTLGLVQPVRRDLPRVVYHAPCSLQHGQQVRKIPKDLIERAGFVVAEPTDSHLCCGSAGTYNLLQPDLAGRLGERKAASLEATGAAIVATGNIGCLEQLSRFGSLPVVHTVELLDWATGGPKPAGVP